MLYVHIHSWYLSYSELPGTNKYNNVVQSVNGVCKLLDRSYGAVWAVVSPPRGRLTIRMLLSGREDGDETWLLPTNDIPHDWKAGRVYDSGVQVLDNWSLKLIYEALDPLLHLLSRARLCLFTNVQLRRGINLTFIWFTSLLLLRTKKQCQTISGPW